MDDGFAPTGGSLGLAATKVRSCPATITCSPSGRTVPLATAGSIGDDQVAGKPRAIAAGARGNPTGA